MSVLPYGKQILPAIFEEETTHDNTVAAVVPPIILSPNETQIGYKSATFNFSSKLEKSSDDTTFIVPQSSPHKPVMRFDTTLSVNLFQIKEIFEKVCKKRGFAIIDDEGDQVTAINKKSATLKDFLCGCIPGRHQNVNNSTAILLHSRTNKISCLRRITLKVLLGNLKEANAFFLDFENELKSVDGKRATISPKPSTTSFFSDQILVLSPTAASRREKTSPRNQIKEEMDETIISAQNLQSASFYEFRKILSSDQYSIGKKVADFMTDFTEKYKDVPTVAKFLPQPMESVYSLVSQVTDIFFADFNYGKSQTKQIMPFCRGSVEKFIFDKVYSQLFKMYLEKYKAESAKFEDKIDKITEKGDFLEQLKFLDIPKKFWLIQPSKLDENNQLALKIEEEELPYIDAINELRKIQILKSPKEKLGSLLMMHSLMKSAAVDFHKGKEEICSMDEELPIIIYILTQANLKNGSAEFNYVNDYVQLDPSLESERRLMTNLKVSLQYIAEEWTVE